FSHSDTMYQPRFYQSDAWETWRVGRARLLQINLGLARNRLPDESVNPIYCYYYSLAFQGSSCTRITDNELIWSLSSRCGKRGSGGCADKTPVLFIHGYQGFASLSWTEAFEVDEEILYGGPGYWNHLTEQLHNEGYAVFGFQWRSSQRFQDAAADLADAIDLIYQNTGNKVHIIAHSFGGLVARTYLQGMATERAYADDVASLITVATPHSGIADETTINGVTLPKGRSQHGGRVIGQCRQLSCYQAGKGHPNTYQAWWGYAVPKNVDLRKYFRVDENHAGAFIVDLANNSSEMPVPMLALYGLTSGCSPSMTQRFGDGDGMISWEGQRAHPGFSCSDGSCEPESISQLQDTSSHFPAGLHEYVLGLPAADGRNVKPNIDDIYSGAADDLRRFCTRWGYRHSDSSPVSRYGSIGQMDIQVGGYAWHSVYTQIAGWLNDAPETEQPNGTNSLINDGVIRGQLGVGDMDSFELDLNAGEAAHIRVARTSGDLQPEVWLYNPDGTLARTDWGSTDAEFNCYSTSRSCKLEQTGTYRLVVASWGSSRSGSYVIHYAGVPQSNQSVPLVSNGVVSGELTVGDIDTFLFYAVAGDPAHIRVARTSGDLRPWVWLYNPDGTLVQTDWGSTDAAFNCYSTSRSCKLEQTGAYRLVVASWGATRTGEYNVSFQGPPQ
ncbi:esterase/lipase family protein, partial [Ectothiorhodospira variabilis]|uniref:esterase/lipase family protein n=1 Tax=Ectothiorhodospira variabilis TaxID=505694 RepID=UPI001EFAC349